LVAGWLRDERKGKWLLVLDNVDNEAVLSLPQEVGTAVKPGNVTNQLRRSLLTYLPQSRNGAILITTRTRSVATKLVEPRDIIEIEPMTNTEATTLLVKKLSGHTSDADLQELATVLEFMPLAIVQAAAYIQRRGLRYSVRRYIAEFQRSDMQKTSLLNYEAGHLRRDPEAKNSIFITWQISFDDIRMQWPLSADLLSLMSFFDPQGIPEEVLRVQTPEEGEHGLVRGNVGDDRDEEGDGHDDEDIPGDMASERSGEDTSDRFEECVYRLLSYSFVSVGSDGRMFEMHRLVQLATQKWLEMHEEDERWRNQFCRKLNAVYPTGEYENWSQCEMLFPHAKAAERQRPIDGEWLREWAQIMRKAGWYALAKGRYSEAERMCGESARALRTVLGEVDVETLNSSILLALVYRYQGRWPEAEKLFMQVMENRRAVLGDDHPDTLTSMTNLASTYRDQGRWSEAEKMEKEVMETKKRVLGEEHPDTLTTIANLASTYRNQGRWLEAEEMDVQVMEIRRRILGEEHPDTLSSMANLASTYQNQGRWTEAEQMFVQVMETSRRVLGEEHPDTLSSMANLASTYQNQGRWTEAETMDVQVMETSRRVLGEEHPSTLTSMANLASTYWNQGRWTEAETIEVQVMEIRRRVLGEEHPDTLNSMNNLAFTMKEGDRNMEAIELMAECVRLRNQVMGTDHPDALSSAAALAKWRDVE
jgi:tetratricopeptide (TPR) repeat protein